MKTIILFALAFLMSCSNYISNVKKQIAREEGGTRKSTRGSEDDYDHFALYRKRQNPELDRRPIKNPVTYSLGAAGPSGQVKPPVKREYRPQRYTADDFVDKSPDGSLWTTHGSSTSIYTNDVHKRAGDMIIINVLENLRNQISAELKRNFPDKKKKKTAKSDDKKSKQPAAPPTPAASTPDQDIDMKVYDKISGAVMEEVSRDYILLRGRKQVIFKKEKRSIEVQALVSRKDILENDYVNSDKLLESKVFVLRKN